MSADFLLGLLLGVAGTALFLLPWLGRLDRQLDECVTRYNELLEEMREAFDLPPWISRQERR